MQARDGVTERISAYRSHASDPLAFSDGGRLVWRVGEGHQPLEPTAAHSLRGGEARTSQVYTKCGNYYPSEAASGARGSVGAPPPPHPRELSPVNVSTYSFVYTWPADK